MKKLLLALLILAPAISPAETGPNPADYTVAVHVQSSRSDCTRGGCTQRLTAVIEGKKYRLEAYSQFAFKLLRTGDYKAKIVKDSKPVPYEYSRDYEFLFSDGRTRKYSVVGETE